MATAGGVEQNLEVVCEKGYAVLFPQYCQLPNNFYPTLDFSRAAKHPGKNCVAWISASAEITAWGQERDETEKNGIVFPYPNFVYLQQG